MFNKKKNIIILTILFSFIMVFIYITPLFSISNKENENQADEVLTDSQLTSSEYAAMFQSVFQYVLGNYVDEVSPDKLFDGAMTGLFNSLGDPHSTYLTKSQLLDLTDTTEGEFGGLGIHIQKQVVGLESDTKSKELPYVKIISPIQGTPAYKMGIKSGDYITAIEGESTIDLTSDDVLDRLRGKPGTEVTISILRNRVVNFDVTIKRAIIEIPTVKSGLIEDLGYVKISQFSHHTATQIKDVFMDFNKKNISGLIIDVRNNPGGLLNSVVDIADYIFDDGLIVSTKSRITEENSQFLASKGTIIDKNLPIAILINNGSASASEILTGVIKDRDRGIVIGNKSFGKGSVQQMRYFADGGFKLTVARFYSPNGVTIDKLGIEPDIQVDEKSISDLTDDETISYIELLNERIIGNYLFENSEISEEMIVKLVEDIVSKGYKLPKDFLVNEIRSRAQRLMDNPPVYDIQNDEVLIKAVEELNKI
ncbi:S41 family peptidase [Thiospirochaeta perfilievii]|uniref:S41 family peptidase n=1 Tax=Thiospirochaeta perfilievii TaxID=252967 RepID=A0A5C1QBE1_9SPIO|nr:S41 family peptidase [Thiospirochaeta perfilievii]QEN04841.1 S41 family peptidase [Thiospirochaeta perfilievii]